MEFRETYFEFDGQTGFYRGKVRDVYYFKTMIVVVATDRISAFDVILPRTIPYKGQVLNQLAAHQLHDTSEVVPSWLVDVPDPNVSVGWRCDPFPVEMVIRGYLAGHAWRVYQSGKRILCGVHLPDGLRENDPLPHPIITPTTKALKNYHDEDISKEEIIRQGLVTKKEYDELEKYTYQLFEKGCASALKQGLLLVDTKYEFGKYEDKIYVMDEIHTPDSSRYFYKKDYTYNQDHRLPQRQLSKEFLRQWLIDHHFQGQSNQTVPVMTDDIVQQVSDRYIELFECMTGGPFVKFSYETIFNRIKNNIFVSLKKWI